MSRAGPDVILVPEGFSWGAFLFQLLWALYHRLWRVALVLFLVVSTVVGLAVLWFGEESSIPVLLNLALSLLIGAEAGNLWRWELERRGYRMEGVVLGESLEEAERRYFQESLFDGPSGSIGGFP